MQRWSFANPVAQSFEDHAERSIPAYRAGQALIVALSDFFAVSSIVEIGGATGSLARRLAERHPSCRVVGVDCELDMVGEARQRHLLDNLEFRCADIRQGVPGVDVDLAVAHHVLQFLLPAERAALIRDVYRSLRQGGALVVFEKCRAAASFAHDVETQLYQEFKLANGLSPAHVIEKAAALRGVMHTLTTAESDAQLRPAGFADPHTVHQELGFRGVLAVKDAG